MENENIVDLIQAGTGNQKELYSMLWENMRGLAAAVARKYSRPDDYEDNMQQGFLGLYEAARNYDPEQGASFSSYAFHWIRQSITRYRNENGAACRFPSHIAELKNKYKRFQAVYMLKCGTVPDDRTICAALGISAEKLSMIRAAEQIESAASADSPIPGADDLTIGDMIRDPSDMIENTDDQLWNEQLAGVLWELVDGLDPEQAEVIRGRFRDDLTRQQIDKRNEWRAGRSADLEYKALRNLRHGKARRELLPFMSDRIASEGMKGTGVQRFNDTWTSATERTALKLCGVDLEERKRSYLKSGF